MRHHQRVVDQLTVSAAVETCFGAVADAEVERGRVWIAGRADWVIGPGDHEFVGLDAEGERGPALRIGADFEIGGDERRVVDRDGEPFVRGNQPVLARFVARQQAGEGAYHGGAGDRGAVVEPLAVGGDAHVAVARAGRVPLVDRGQAARSNRFGDFGKRKCGKFGRRLIRHG